jgi:hypothetical protein
MNDDDEDVQCFVCRKITRLTEKKGNSSHLYVCKDCREKYYPLTKKKDVNNHMKADWF